MEHNNEFEKTEYDFSNVRYMYVNAGGVANGDNDFIMQVETSLPSGIADVQNLVMTPRMAKVFRDMFNNAIDNYEDIVGEIYMGTGVTDAYNGESDSSENAEDIKR